MTNDPFYSDDYSIWRGIKKPDDPKAEAEKLTAQGYRRVSNAHAMLSRVDRPDWQQVLEENGLRSDDEDMYRRTYSKDTITVHFMVSKHVPGSTSAHDKTGYIPLADEDRIHQPN